jgi:opacity protein-like surface antigen
MYKRLSIIALATFLSFYICNLIKAAEAPLQQGEVLYQRTGHENQYRIGRSVAFFGGVNMLQSGTVHLREAYTGMNNESDFSIDSGVSPVVGLRVGFTWPDCKDFLDFEEFKKMFELDDQYVDGNFHMMPACDLEFMYTGKDVKAVGAGIGDIKGETDAFIFSINPMLKFQIRQWRPYFGVGLGFAYMTLENLKYNLNYSGNTAAGAVFTGDSDDAACFAFQGIVGTEYFLDSKFSVFTEYKYLYLIDPSFNSVNSATSRLQYQLFSNHMLDVGLRYHF